MTNMLCGSARVHVCLTLWSFGTGIGLCGQAIAALDSSAEEVVTQSTAVLQALREHLDQWTHTLNEVRITVSVDITFVFVRANVICEF